MRGWPVAWKCLVACLFGDESQQPTWPHVRQSRRCTHESPVARHSSQPSVLGVTGRICLRWGQVCGGMVVLLPVDVESPLTLRLSPQGRGEERRYPSLPAGEERRRVSHLLEILMNKLDRHGAFADGGGDALD